MPRKKRCVSPTFDETEQQLSQSSQSSQLSQPSQSLQPAVDTPALFGDVGDNDDDDEPTSRWSSREHGDGLDTTARTSAHAERDRPAANGLLAADDSQMQETAAQEDSVADLLDEVARSGSKERGKENTLPARASSSSFNVSMPRSLAVNHGCDEATDANASSAAGSGADATAATTKTGEGASSPVPTLSTSQTQQLTQHSPDLFPEEEDAATKEHSNTGTKAASSFKVKLRARTPFTQSQRS